MSSRIQKLARRMMRMIVVCLSKARSLLRASRSFSPGHAEVAIQLSKHISSHLPRSTTPLKSINVSKLDLCLGFVGDICFTREMSPAAAVVSIVGGQRLPTPGSGIAKGMEALSIPRLVERQAILTPNSADCTDAYMKWFRPVSLKPDFTPDTQFDAASTLRGEVDVLFGNLETPLTDKQRKYGMFSADQTKVQGLKRAGFTLLSVANNHAFDAGYEGLRDTIQALSVSGIQQVGYCKRVYDETCITNTHVNGSTVAWIAPTQKCNIGLASSAATARRDGIIAMDPELVCDLIQIATKTADVVVVVPHWSWDESMENPEACVIECGHLFVDAGAHAVVGSGPHVVQGCELYKNSLISYCLGNFIFGHNANNWGDNLMLKLAWRNGKCSATFIPISGGDSDLYSPHILREARAHEILQHFAQLSQAFGTRVEVQDERGYVTWNV